MWAKQGLQLTAQLATSSGQPRFKASDCSLTRTKSRLHGPQHELVHLQALMLIMEAMGRFVWWWFA